jgi:RNA polymerase sigma-70 factor (ECF subfamily)
MSVPRLEITEYRRAWEQGDDRARAAPAHGLRRAARHRRAASPVRAGRPTLQPTALANEAYLRLRDLSDVPWHDRSHFFAIASRIMPRILVDHARAKMAGKPGGADAQHVPLADGLHGGLQPVMESVELIHLDRALNELAESEPRLSRLASPAPGRS